MRDKKGRFVKGEKTVDNTVHGHRRRGYRSPTYYSWCAMKERCNRPKHPRYARYGGRGISVCDRWHFFENFLFDMGERPEGKNLDRIDNDSGYYKENCKWSNPKEQANNRCNNLEKIV